LYQLILEAGCYAEARVLTAGMRLESVALPEVAFDPAELFR